MCYILLWISGSVEKAMVDVLAVLDREAAAQAISQLIQTYSCLADLAQSQGELDYCCC